MKLNRKGGGTSLTLTQLIGLTMGLLLFVFVFQTYGRINSGDPDLELSNFELVPTIVDRVNSAFTVGDEISDEEMNSLIPEEQQDLYHPLKYSTIPITMDKHEFFFFFSGGSDPIILKTPEHYAGEVKEIKFFKPTECGEYPCVCYSDLKLWELNSKLDDFVEYTIKEKEELKKGFKLKVPTCEQLPQKDLIFMNSRGYFDESDDKYLQYLYSDIWNKLPIPLEIFSVRYYLPKKSAKEFLFGMYNNNDLQRKEILDLTIRGQHWSGGVVVGDYGYMDGGNSIAGEIKQKVYLYFVPLSKDGINAIGVGVNTPYVVKTKDPTLKRLTFVNLKDLIWNSYKINLDNPKTPAKLGLEQLEDSTKPFKEINIFSFFEKTSSLNFKETKLLIKNVLKDEKEVNGKILRDSLVVKLGTDSYPCDTDVDFKFGTQISGDTICLSGNYEDPQDRKNTGFIDCDRKNYYLFKKLKDLDGISKIMISKHEIPNTICYSYDLLFFTDPEIDETTTVKSKKKILTLNNVVDIEVTENPWQTDPDLVKEDCERYQIPDTKKYKNRITNIKFFDGAELYFDNIFEYKNCGYELKKTTAMCLGKESNFEGDEYLTSGISFNMMSGIGGYFG